MKPVEFTEKQLVDLVIEYRRKIRVVDGIISGLYNADDLQKARDHSKHLQTKLSDYEEQLKELQNSKEYIKI